jgi:hypothetical protein
MYLQGVVLFTKSRFFACVRHFHLVQSVGGKNKVDFAYLYKFSANNRGNHLIEREKDKQTERQNGS